MASDPAVEAARRRRRKLLDEYGITDVKPGHEGATFEEIEAAREALAPLRKHHRPVHAVFAWNRGVTLYDPCPDCHGKAGVHQCGCWGDEDVTYQCATCRDDKGHLADWPTATDRLIYPSEELS